MTQTFEEQAREINQKARKYDELKSIVSKKLEAVEEHQRKMNEAIESLYDLFGLRIDMGQKQNRTPEIQEMYRKLVSGEKASYTMEEVENILGVSKSNASYWFYKLCEMEGIEKVKNEGERTKAIFHHTRMG